MMRLATAAVMLAASLIGLAPASAADWRNAPPKSYAVIVGVGTFDDAKIKARPSAEEDAKGLYDVFTDPKVGGIAKDRVHLFTGTADEARNGQVGTREAILKALADVTGKAQADELIYFIMIGQGGSKGQQAVIFAKDSTVKDREKTAITAPELEKALKGLKSQLCTMTDINYKGFDAGEEVLLNPTLKDFTDLFLGIKSADQDDDNPAKDGRVLVMAGRGLSDPLVIDKHGLFAKVTIDALKGAADKDGYEPDGLVTLDEYSKYLYKEVPALAQKLGKDQKDRFQLPIVVAGVDTHFVMTLNPAVYPKVEERLKKLEAMFAGKKISPEIDEEAKKYLSRMPKLKTLQSIRKDYEAMVDGAKTVEETLAARAKILDGMKLDRKDALKYAELLVDGCNRVKGMFIRDVNLNEMVANGVRGMYHRVDEKLAPELDNKLKNLQSLRRSEVLETIADARMPLGNREDLENHKDADISFQAMSQKLGDKYTTYYDKDKVEEIEKLTKGSFSGIGVVIRADLNKDALRVVSPIKGSPAYKAGLRTGDLILTIKRDVDRDGKKLDKTDITSTKGMDTADAVKLITGKAGTQVTLSIEREGEKDPIEYTLTRGTVEVESVLGWKRKDDDNWDYYVDPENKIAYIYLNQFSRKSDQDMERVVAKLEKEGIKGLILDLRFNGGGYLDVVERMADMFIDDGTIVTIKYRPGTIPNTSKPGHSAGSYTRFPMVCLINGESASASEILSACLQDHNRAVIMGERSYGKGSVQTIDPYDKTGGEFKVTIATFWRPNGKNLNKSSTKGTPDEDWGVRPEGQYELKLDPQEHSDLHERLVNDWTVIARKDAKAKEKDKETAKPFKDRQLDMAIEYLRSQIKANAAVVPLKKAG